MVSASLGRLTAAVKGEVPLLEETEEIYQALVSNVVPRAWQVGVVLRLTVRPPDSNSTVRGTGLESYNERASITNIMCAL